MTKGNKMKIDEAKIRKAILRKLKRHGYWGNRHTSFDNLPKGFPSHLHREVKMICKKLIKEGIIIAKPTGYGIEISLNPRRSKEIMFYINVRKL